MVVHVKADQTQNRDLEQDFPSGHDTAKAIETLGPLNEQGVFFTRGPGARGNNRRKDLKLVPSAQLIGEQDADIEGPRRNRNIRPGEAFPNLVVHDEDCQDFEGRNAMKRGNEYEAECKVKAHALL